MRRTRHRWSRRTGTIASVLLGAAAAAVSTVPPASASSGAGVTRSCAVRDDGTLWCWGSAWGTRFDSSRNESTPVPVQESTASTTWSDVGIGWRHVCATRTDGTLWGWGRNRLGQLGNGTFTNQRTPVRNLFTFR
jgi:alpha-tubulin suppressor-like RCC1 family protein